MMKRERRRTRENSQSIAKFIKIRKKVCERNISYLVQIKKANNSLHQVELLIEP